MLSFFFSLIVLAAPCIFWRMLARIDKPPASSATTHFVLSEIENHFWQEAKRNARESN